MVRTGDFCDVVDAEVMTIINIVASADVAEDYSDVALKRLRLPIRNRGMGFRSLANRADSQIIGGIFHDGFTALIDRKDKDGNCWAGRLVIQPVVDALGEGSFDAGSKTPWQTLIDCNSQYGSILQIAWAKYSHFYQEAGLDRSEGGEDMLIAQPVELAGFYPDGRHPKKVTKAITDEVEDAIFQILDQEMRDRPADDPERWAWQNIDKISGLALENVPDSVGWLPNDAVVDTFASYMGQPWPGAREHRGNFFGKNGEELDEYGHNLASARLPGVGFRLLHNNVTSLMVDIMREAGFLTDKEAWNMFHGKVPSPWINQYSTAINRERGDRRVGSDRRRCIVPDIICYNFISSDGRRRAGRNCSNTGRPVLGSIWQRGPSLVMA